MAEIASHLDQKYATCRNGVRASVQRSKNNRKCQKQEDSPQGQLQQNERIKHLDENMDVALDLDADKLPTQLPFLQRMRQIQITSACYQRWSGRKSGTERE